MKKAVAEQEIQNRLREMEARFSAHIERIQIEEVRKTANFREFLDEIDGLKAQIAQAFPSMQRTVVLLIHRKATELLVDAWNNPDVVQASLRHEAFLNLMMTVSEELGEIGGAGPTKQLPERTIKLIRHEG